MDRTDRDGAAGQLGTVENRAVIRTRELVGGAATLIVAGLFAVVVYPAAEPGGRILVVAIACGALAAIFTDPWAIGVVAIAGALAFVLVLAQPAAERSGPDPVAFTPLVGLAVLVGAGYRRLSRLARDGT